MCYDVFSKAVCFGGSFTLTKEGDMPEIAQFNSSFRYFESCQAGRSFNITGGPCLDDMKVSFSHGNLVMFALSARYQVKMRVSGLKLQDDPLSSRGIKVYEIECWSQVYEKNGRNRYILFKGEYNLQLRAGYLKIYSVWEQSNPKTRTWNLVGPEMVIPGE